MPPVRRAATPISDLDKRPSKEQSVRCVRFQRANPTPAGACGINWISAAPVGVVQVRQLLPAPATSPSRHRQPAPSLRRIVAGPVQKKWLEPAAAIYRHLADSRSRRHCYEASSGNQFEIRQTRIYCCLCCCSPGVIGVSGACSSKRLGTAHLGGAGGFRIPRPGNPGDGFPSIRNFHQRARQH